MKQLYIKLGMRPFSTGYKFLTYYSRVSVSIVTWLSIEMTKLLISIKLLVFVLWTSNLIFLPKGVETRVMYGTLYRDYGLVYGYPHQFDFIVDEDLKKEADLPQPLNFDGKLDSKEYTYILFTSTCDFISTLTLSKMTQQKKFQSNQYFFIL